MATVDFPLLGDGLVMVITFLSGWFFCIALIFTIRDSTATSSLVSSESESKSSIKGITPTIGKLILLSKISAGFDIGRKLKPLTIATKQAIIKPIIVESMTNRNCGLT